MDNKFANFHYNTFRGLVSIMSTGLFQYLSIVTLTFDYG